MLFLAIKINYRTLSKKLTIIPFLYIFKIIQYIRRSGFGVSIQENIVQKKEKILIDEIIYHHPGF